MRVWLINPPVIRERPTSIGSVVQNMFYNSPPLGLAYLAAVLEGDGHRCFITDSPVEQLTVRDLPAMARELRPDIVGITSSTPYFVSAVDTAQALRAELGSKVTLCIGGPHFNASPDLLLQHHEFDFGVRGEGEYTLQEAVQEIEAGRRPDDVPGVVVRHGDELHFAAPRPLLDDLSPLPMPARHLLPIDKYVPLPNDEYRLPKTAMITSRGCPYQCIFCAHHTFGHRHRTNRAERVVEEMHQVVGRYGVRDVAFVDSLFTPNRNRVNALLTAMEKDPPGVSWTCSCRANLLSEDMLRRMKANGCWKIRIAIESGNEEVLKTIKKQVTKEQFAETVHIADRLGIQVKAFFMIGHIGDTAETIEETIDFACSLPLVDVTAQINTPLPGTPQYEMARSAGTLVTEDASHYSFFEPVFVPEGMTGEQLNGYLRTFYRRFYLRPSLVRRRLREVRRPYDLAKYFRALPLVANVMFTNRYESIGETEHAPCTEPG